MFEKRWLATIGLLAGLGIQLSAHAEIVVGGGIGFSQLSEYEDVDEGTSWRGFAGYRASEYPIYLEFQYFDSGELDVDDFDGFQDISLEFDGFAIAAGYRIPLGDQGSDFIIKGGAFKQDSEARTSIGSIDDDGSGALIGLGGNWMFTPHFGMNLDLQVLFGVQDFADEEDLTLATVGLIYTFYNE